MNIIFNNGVVEEYTIVLSKRNYEHVGQLVNVTDFTYTRKMNGANEISFSINKSFNGITESKWDDILDLRLVWIKELNEYFEIQVTLNDALSPVKNITGTALCEAELGQTILRDIQINTKEDIERDDYVVAHFYDEDDVAHCLLGRILDKTPHYTIGHIDDSLKNLAQVSSFSISNTSVYDFLTGECAKQYNCLFIFDSTNRTINAYDLYTVCEDCGYRADYTDICPECNSKKLKYYGRDTAILVSVDNLTDEISYETDVPSIKNCFKMEAGDALMTATVANCNPNGTSYIYYFSDESLRDMSAELQAKIAQYNIDLENCSASYKTYVEGYYNSLDNISKYRDTMMPVSTIQGDVTATTELAKLTTANLSPVAVSNIATASKETVETAIKNWAKVVALSGYVKIEISTSPASTYTYNSSTKKGTWTGAFKVTNYKDSTDVKTGSAVTITINDDMETFVNQKVIKNIQEKNTERYDILSYDVVNLTGEVLDTTTQDYNLVKFNSFTELRGAFMTALFRYCYERLHSFYDAFGTAMDMLIQLGQAEKTAEMYNQAYSRYKSLQKDIESVMNTYAGVIANYERNRDGYLSAMNQIHDTLNFEKYLGTTLFKEFCSFRREDTYTNSNFISDDLNNAQEIQRAVEFIEKAKKEIVKSGEYQHSISSTLNNLLLIPEFAPIVDNFDVGNWIRFKVDGELFRLRLTSFTINFSSLQTINTEFSTLTKSADGVNDVKSILDKASSMATSYSYVTQQATDGADAYVQITNIVKDGLDSALVNIKNNDHEEVVIDEHGITAQAWDDITEDFDKKQLRITHNVLAFTDDNWDSVRTALGEHSYIKYDVNAQAYVTDTAYGLSADFVSAGYIYGSQLISGDIYSEPKSDGTYSAHINLNDGTFSLADGKLTYDGSKLSIGDIKSEINANILRGTNTTTTLGTTCSWEYGTWRTVNQASYKTSIKVSDLNGIINGWTINGISSADNLIGQNYVPLVANQQYTISVYAKGIGEVKMQAETNATTRKYKTRQIKINNVTEWTQYSYTFSYTDAELPSGTTVNIYFGQYNTTTPIDIAGMKLELGDKATQWSASPYDYLNSTDYLYPGKTTIDGGNIETGSIRTNSLTAEAITTSWLEATGPQYIAPTEKDRDVVKKFIYDGVTPTAKQLDLYDFNQDGVINAIDYLYLIAYLNGIDSIPDAYKNSHKVNVKATINPSSEKIINITATSPFAEGTVENYLSSNKLKIPQVECETLTVEKAEISYIPQGYNISKGMTGNVGISGHIQIIQINVTKSYANSEIQFDIVQRGGYTGSLYVKFSNASSTQDYTIEKIYTVGNLKPLHYILYKFPANDSIQLNIYIEKSEKYDNIAVTDLYITPYMKERISVTFPDVQTDTALANWILIDSFTDARNMRIKYGKTSFSNLVKGSEQATSLTFSSNYFGESPICTATSTNSNAYAYIKNIVVNNNITNVTLGIRNTGSSDISTVNINYIIIGNN